ncbi:hypothetical protein SAMN05216357_103110 [Porphyromonadaceae bacterium KH3CP3RA]|nr:hypothetical protein SAMN05216357_103110 [Porphyromonadaceae bacterium KH3CP3RA]
MNTAIIEIKNDIAYDFLENLERMQVIRIVRQRPSQRRKKRKLSKRFAGALHLSDKQYEEMQGGLTKLREGWERNIL